MASYNMPTYYHPGSILDVELEPHAIIQQFVVVRALTPFTVAQILIVREHTGNHYGAQEILMKVYDPRFMDYSRKMPWISEVEAQAAESRKDWRMPSVLNPYDLPGPSDRETPLEEENYIFFDALLHHYNEVRAYTFLKPLQGQGIPILWGHGKLSSATMRADPAPRYINPSVLLIEYIPNALTLKDVDPAMLRPDLIRSLLDTVDSIEKLYVIHDDPHPENYLFTQNRAVVIDFGKAFFREAGETEEDWIAVVQCHRIPPYVRRLLAQKLSVESLDDYLNTAT